jgi:hypothetical protein
MELSQIDQKKIADWLGQKCGQMRCTCCGFSNWQILPMATLPIGIDLRSTRFFYAQGNPQVSVVCTNCGHLLSFSPFLMGIRPDEPKPAPLAAETPKPDKTA